MSRPWASGYKGCPCRDCDRRLVGCHGLCPEYQAWKRETERIKDEKREESVELPRKMRRHIWRMMLRR